MAHMIAEALEDHFGALICINRADGRPQ